MEILMNSVGRDAMVAIDISRIYKDWFLRNWLIQVVLPLPEGPEMAMRWDMGKEFTVCGSGRVP